MRGTEKYRSILKVQCARPQDARGHMQGSQGLWGAARRDWYNFDLVCQGWSGCCEEYHTWGCGRCRWKDFSRCVLFLIRPLMVTLRCRASLSGMRQVQTKMSELHSGPFYRSLHGIVVVQRFIVVVVADTDGKSSRYRWQNYSVCACSFGYCVRRMLLSSSSLRTLFPSFCGKMLPSCVQKGVSLYLQSKALIQNMTSLNHGSNWLQNLQARIKQ